MLKSTKNLGWMITLDFLRLRYYTNPTIKTFPTTR
jgi:hypothetical protein